MRRQFLEPKLVMATHNPGKLREARIYLKDCNVELISAAELGLPEPDETESTYIGNARIKAIAAMQATGLPALSDDSGFEMHALGNWPGVNTASLAGPERDFKKAFDCVKRRLEEAGSTDTSISIYSALVLAWPDGHVEEYLGRVEGEFLLQPRGEKGFAFDPMFLVKLHDKTFAEMTGEEKLACSHRGDAFKKLLAGSFNER